MRVGVQTTLQTLTKRSPRRCNATLADVWARLAAEPTTEIRVPRVRGADV